MGTGVYVAGVGMTKFGKTSQTLPDLMVEAASKAFSDAQVATIDYILIGVMNAEEFTGKATCSSDRRPPGTLRRSVLPRGNRLFHGIGRFRIRLLRRSIGLSSQRPDYCRGKNDSPPTARTTKILAGVIERDERNYGASMPALAAMITQRYQHETRLSAERMQGILAKLQSKIITTAP